MGSVRFGMVGMLLMVGSIAVANEVGTTETKLQRQQRYLSESRSINRTKAERYPTTTRLDKTWEDWQSRTGELPPDFASMLKRPLLPNPREWRSPDGTTTQVRTAEDWQQKREWIREQFQYWVSGHRPPAPDNLRATIVSDTQPPGQARVQLIQLRFGPEHKGLMTMELIIPPGEGPHPVYMTQWNHRDWAQLAVRRGYIGCVYAGADAKDDSEDFQHLYPEYEFSRLMRRAWGASRIVDYLVTRADVNSEQIAITGHSRNGKQSLWAAAFDERIGAVITSSCGTGGVTPWRYSDPQFCNETIDAITAVANTWFHPRLRYFFGREDYLPIDQNELLALIAPRPLLIHYSDMERQLNPWVVEQNFRSTRDVYRWLEAKNRIGVFARAGEHAVAARDLERCIDFLDIHFERRNLPWADTLAFDYDFEEWKASRSETVAEAANMEPLTLREKYADNEWQAERKQILEKLDWLLGPEPGGTKPREVKPTVASRYDWMDKVTGRPELQNAKIINIGPYTALGDHIAASLYYPAKVDDKSSTGLAEKIPVVIYLHQYAYHHGFAIGYRPESGGSGSRMVLQRMIDRGYAVLAIDMFGFGRRWHEATYFYKRQPEWSKMGKMVTDVSACVDAVEGFDFIDSKRIYVLGDTIGGSVGLIAAARDIRIAGVGVVAAVSPWRSSNAEYETIRTYAHLHGFLPRLGLFADDPARVPVDIGEILATIAPRKLMVVAPSLDRHTNHNALDDTLEKVSTVYEASGAQNQFKIRRPLDINRMSQETQVEILEFFATN